MQAREGGPGLQVHALAIVDEDEARARCAPVDQRVAGPQHQGTVAGTARSHAAQGHGHHGGIVAQHHSDRPGLAAGPLMPVVRVAMQCRRLGLRHDQEGHDAGERRAHRGLRDTEGNRGP